jgi:hypothetical protein
MTEKHHKEKQEKSLDPNDPEHDDNKSVNEILSGIEERRPLLDVRALERVLDVAKQMLRYVVEMNEDVELTDSQRRTLNGSRARRFGFINRVMVIAEENLDLAPRSWQIETMRLLVRNMDLLKQIQAVLAQIIRLTDDELLIVSNQVYQMALEYYGSVHSLANRHNPLAMSIFNILREFFTHRRSNATTEEKEPTEKQLKHDFNSLLHGTKEGEIIIENHPAHLTGGQQEIIDETHKPLGEFKAVEHGIICPNCHTENLSHHDFCYKCGKALAVVNK